VHVEDISYEVDGIEMIGHLAYDDFKLGKRPAVLLSHEGPGLEDHVRGRAQRLAALGYCAFALDYHGGGQLLPMEEMNERLGTLMEDPAATRRRGLAGLDVLLAQDVADADRVACIGYCFGGSMSVEIGRSGADVKAIVGFHPGLLVNPGSEHITGSVLMIVGTEDPFVPVDARLAFEQDMKDGGVADWRIDLYGGVGHSFTNKNVDLMGMPGLAYHEPSDRRSWNAMLALFEETIPLG
jgi:dienelactone hydrolase